MIYLYGDSHARESFKNLPCPHEMMAENSVTMHRIGRDKVVVNWVPCEPNDTLFFVYGEVDCRAHVGKQIALGRDEDSVINEVATEYIDTIQKVAVHGHVNVVSVIPPTAEGDYRAQYPGYPLPFVGTDEERVRYTKKLNACLRQLCHTAGFIFFDPYAPYMREDGCLRRELSDGNVHVGNNELIIAQLR